MDQVRNDAAGFVVTDLVAVMKANRAYLSEIDGAIGDGDHGINMSKGFGAAGERLAGAPAGLSQALATLGETLIEGVGGSMGPLYGNFFGAMAEAVGKRDVVDAPTFAAMLDAGLAAIQEIGGAKVGDKTLLDALVPARDAFAAALAAGRSFSDALDAMAAAAEKGKESTRDLVARVGRASRLGERSKGVLDAGATSCALILGSMARSLKSQL
ncbi:dihydroxyacetone kinase subunit DhaL [Anaeromyxobacter oryzae]|uniref:Dihydroxyacetone kinase subunit L n=1 Tax=Anaeromyxobacter oryzae TaxID=2918170 RepID=A0ABM7WPL8_9BACT|nr:dihydroxyacetone kinase subunit DhaL [Anaeromyxobacter oryzae]BDG01414.1 dihydroxyacetone kinase subunit L [Anaeromyxobacter oryzae]